MLALRRSSALPRLRCGTWFRRRATAKGLIHIDDIARANLASLEAISVGDGPEPGQLRAYNAGSGHPHTVAETAEALAGAYGGPAPIVTGDYRLGDVRHITASSDRISRELGWHAQVAFADGMAEFAQLQ
jgi:dTDP-L-rhamnose 4-epimerase